MDNIMFQNGIFIVQIHNSTRGSNNGQNIATRTAPEKSDPKIK
jgi:hypothetical protein